MATENKPENKPAPAAGGSDISADAIKFIAGKFQELKQELAHALARLEAVEKQLGDAIDKNADAAGKKGKGVLDSAGEFLDSLFK